MHRSSPFPINAPLSACRERLTPQFGHFFARIFDEAAQIHEEY